VECRVPVGQQDQGTDWKGRLLFEELGSVVVGLGSAVVVGMYVAVRAVEQVVQHNIDFNLGTCAGSAENTHWMMAASDLVAEMASLQVQLRNVLEGTTEIPGIEILC
jgi:hypothetical protein